MNGTILSNPFFCSKDDGRYECIECSGLIVLCNVIETGELVVLGTHFVPFHIHWPSSLVCISDIRIQ